MGACIIKRNRVASAPPTSACVCKTVSELKESLIFHIFRLHILILNCRKNIEKCLIEKNKDNAILIRCKEIVVKGKLEELQEFVRALDLFMDFMGKDKGVKKRILKDGQVTLKGVNSLPYTDDLAMIMENDQDYKILIRDELKKLGVNEKTVSIQIEQEYQNRRGADKNKFIRRKYVKDIKLNV
ncbi:hypothetical protein SteCoe_13061 [Stentor coeruleus]|uniref:Uncharacterized protein n=1 Tax=Stentor coeruleus TaxID=5963 RepID=A0A1R2C9E2_9CILI|nr:hypothetical protein SteCoe_13061 [Stentor coeruleus]